MKTISLSLFICLAVCISVGHGKSPKRVRNGMITRNGEFPFMAALFHNFQFLCSGSIIDGRHILTAAHCVISDYMIIHSNILVEIGTSSLFDKTHVQYLYASMVILHQGWFHNDKWAHDIAILTLEYPIRFSQYVQPIALPDGEINVSSGAELTLIGWGPSSPGEPVQFQRKARMRRFQIETCIYLWSEFLVDRQNNFCAVGVEDMGVIKGDSGGPLVYNNKVIGVVSRFLQKEVMVTLPDIFIRVDRHLSWIITTIRRY